MEYSLWKYHKLQQVWVLKKSCESEEDAQRWLMMLSTDDATERFCISSDGVDPKIYPSYNGSFCAADKAQSYIH